MKAFLIRLMALGAAGLLLACAPSAPPTAAPTPAKEAEPKYGGRLSLTGTSDPRSLDPQAAQSAEVQRLASFRATRWERIPAMCGLFPTSSGITLRRRCTHVNSLSN